MHEANPYSLYLDSGIIEDVFMNRAENLIKTALCKVEQSLDDDKLFDYILSLWLVKPFKVIEYLPFFTDTQKKILPYAFIRIEEQGEILLNNLDLIVETLGKLPYFVYEYIIKQRELSSEPQELIEISNEYIKKEYFEQS